jgi:hypothetical protein
LRRRAAHQHPDGVAMVFATNSFCTMTWYIRIFTIAWDADGSCGHMPLTPCEHLFCRRVTIRRTRVIMVVHVQQLA